MAVKTFIFSDLNVRDEFVSDSTSVLIYDTEDIIQSVWRLLNTEEGEIPNYRNYGINVKQFLQYPLAYETIKDIYDYVKGKIETYETRVSVYRANADVDFDNGLISSNEMIAFNTLFNHNACYLNSFYYTLRLFSMYLDSPTYVLGIIDDVLNHRLTTRDVINRYLNSDNYSYEAGLSEFRSRLK